jgi:MFS transporter, DHA1 family, inner membrane transport protein
VIVITLLGVVSMAIPPVATGLSVRLAGSAPTLAGALTVSAFNGGVATGSAIGGHTLNTSLGQTGPATLGVAMVALGLIPLAVLAMRRDSRTKTSNDNHRVHACTAQAARA